MIQYRNPWEPTFRGSHVKPSFFMAFGVQGPKLSKNHAQEHFKKHTCLGEYALSSTSIMGIMPSWHLLDQVWHLHGAYGMIAVRGVLFLFPFRVSENILPCGIDELLGDGFKYFYFHPNLGEMIQFD